MYFMHSNIVTFYYILSLVCSVLLKCIKLFWTVTVYSVDVFSKGRIHCLWANFSIAGLLWAGDSLNILKNANLQMRLDPFKYFCVLKNDTIKAHCYWTHQLFMVFKSDLLCSLANYCFITLSTKKAKILREKLDCWHHWMSQCCSMKSGLDSSLYTLMNNPEDFLDSVLGLVHIVFCVHFPSVCLLWTKPPKNKHLPNLVSFLEISDRSINPDSERSCRICGISVRVLPSLLCWSVYQNVFSFLSSLNTFGGVVKPM